MWFADVALDIPTRALDGCFSYAVPPEVAASFGEDPDAVRSGLVGMTVLVPFSGRKAIGYILGASEEPPCGLDAGKLKMFEQVLAPSAFDEVSAGLIRWIKEGYASTLADAVRPFLAPGQAVRVRKNDQTGHWELVQHAAGPRDVRWAELAPDAAAFVPRANASKQKGVLKALSEGPCRVAELEALLPGASSAIRTLASKGVVRIFQERELRELEETTLSSASAKRPEHLTEGQKKALSAIAAAQAKGAGDVVLIDGVTGSGKTEVYLEAIEKTLAEGHSAIVLVPEISLTAQTVGRFRSRFGDKVAVLHSRLSQGERYDQWDLARKGIAQVVVGARSALFAPVHDLGLLIIDEEHEASYKQDSAPRYHAREVAAELAKRRGAALVLGSATPSLESLWRCREGSFRGAQWTRVEMPERPGIAELPAVQIVDMASQFSHGNKSIFSEPLQEALDQVVEKKQKAVLLLNRRGFANFLMCRECGCVPECPHCATALTYHERTHSLMCHSCGRSWPIKAYPDPTTRCPNCGSRYLAQFGVGTQRVEDELKALLPDNVTVVRMDADTTKAKGAHEALLEEFDNAECAVLVGTQMIAKGLDFPEVTLAAVINADTTLKLPDFRAAERTYDLLEQVAGRAGRGEDPGKVIIQTYWATHPAIEAVRAHDKETFVECELEARSEAHYPPFSRLSNIVLWGKDARQVRELSIECAEAVRKKIGSQSGWEVLGPADCVKAKVEDRYRRHVLVKSPVEADVGRLLADAVASLRKPHGVSLAIDIDAYDLI